MNKVIEEDIVKEKDPSGENNVKYTDDGKMIINYRRFFDPKTYPDYQTEEVCIEAIKRNPFSISNVTRENLTNNVLITYAKSGADFRFINKSLNELSIEVKKEFVKNNHRNFNTVLGIKNSIIKQVLEEREWLTYLDKNTNGFTYTEDILLDVAEHYLNLLKRPRYSYQEFDLSHYINLIISKNVLTVETKIGKVSNNYKKDYHGSKKFDDGLKLLKLKYPNELNIVNDIYKNY